MDAHLARVSAAASVRHYARDRAAVILADLSPRNQEFLSRARDVLEDVNSANSLYAEEIKGAFHSAYQAINATYEVPPGNQEVRKSFFPVV